MYRLLTVNVRTRTKINIPQINFIKENSQDAVAPQSSLELLFILIKPFPSNLGWSKAFLEAGKRQLTGDTARKSGSEGVKELRAENMELLKFWETGPKAYQR